MGWGGGEVARENSPENGAGGMPALRRGASGGVGEGRAEFFVEIDEETAEGIEVVEVGENGNAGVEGETADASPGGTAGTER
jgi:hypothetical protein